VHSFGEAVILKKLLADLLFVFAILALLAPVVLASVANLK
jgi:hypothetical protein